MDTPRAAGSGWATSVSGEAESTSELDLRRGAGGQDGWGMRVDFQVYKDANDHLSLCDQCDQASLLATHVATQDVQPEDAAHEFRSQVAMGRARGGAGGVRGARKARGVGPGPLGDDVVTPGRRRGQHAVIGLQMRSRRGHESGETLEKDQHGMRRRPCLVLLPPGRPCDGFTQVQVPVDRALSPMHARDCRGRHARSSGA